MPQPLTDAINALTTYANTVTGASDTTLSDAVATLASGYGGSNDIELSDQGLWEVGATNGQIGQTFSANERTNDARLRLKYPIYIGGGSYKFTMNWDNGAWVAMYQFYGSDKKSKTNFTTMTSDTIIPSNYPFLAVVLRHGDGTTAMNVSDISIMQPILIKQ